MTLQAMDAWLGVSPDEMEPFDVEDPFNPPNRLEGFLCRRSDHRYGALCITRVNGEPAEQIVYGTPKLHYPFSTDDTTGERRYHWPTIEEIRVYDKLDGTNILMYSYSDAAGKRFVTFKTRLTPALRASKFGDFIALWKEILTRFPALLDAESVRAGREAWSFELYGYRNHITILYPNALDARLLFGVHQATAKVIPPEDCEGASSFADLLNPLAQSAGSRREATVLYTELRQQAHDRNEVNSDGALVGTEGYVLYVRNVADGWVMYKCKPEEIEDLHWASGAISRHAVMTTARNALESLDIDALTVTAVNVLLQEEFTEAQIAKSAVRIALAVDEVRAWALFSQGIAARYSACPQEIIAGGKAPIMRYMSRFYERGEMKKVYNALHEQGRV